MGTEGITGRDIILTGVPRSGTTLVCRLLNGLPDTVALHEPIKVTTFAQLADDEAVGRHVGAVFAQMRESILTNNMATSRNVEGIVRDNAFEDRPSESGRRPRRDRRGEIRIEKPLTKDFLLIVKHNSEFTGVLDGLTKRFPTYAVIRNPLATLASWNTVEIPIHRGHAGAAERFDKVLAEQLRQIEDTMERQIHLLSWFLRKYQTHLRPQSILRHEDLIASRGKALAVISPHARALDEPLQARNQNPLYDSDLMRRLGDKLLKTDGPYWDFYPKQSVEELLNH